jgi:histidinol dehydrogenase
MIAGPSEILIIADHTAQPEWLAADLLAQAEHDPLASAILVCTDRPVAQAVVTALNNQLQKLPRQAIAKKSIDTYGAILVTDTLQTAFDLANRIAPEHLELQITNPMDYIDLIRNAGAVFVGRYTPEPMGDYVAGPNHVLPTASTARFSSALSVDHFQKKTSLIRYTAEAFRKEARDVMRLARIEGLDAHAQAIELRLNSNP